MSEEQGTYGSSAEELLDQLDATATHLGRLFAARHSMMADCAGMTMHQMVTLRILSDHGALRIGELAAMLGVKAPAASSMVDSLEKAGYLGREHDAEDRRVWRLHVTEAGLEALGRMERERREHMRKFLPYITEDEMRAIIRIQRKLIDAMTSGKL